MMAHKRYAAALMLAVCVPAPLLAENAPKTRLVKCGAQSCLVVTGKRSNADSQVRLNGYEVRTDGRYKWHVRLPVDTIRAWSAPNARTVTVSIEGASMDAKLPIGLMGHANLAVLIVRVK